MAGTAYDPPRVLPITTADATTVSAFRTWHDGPPRVEIGSY
jgi:hypothetical protein